MDERPTAASAVDVRPPTVPDVTAPTRSGTALEDPQALTILTTEHWSLLSSRGLVYNEAFSRGGMFLSFLSATLVALGLVSTGTGFSTHLLAVAAGLFALDLFIGIATIGRLAAATGEDIRCLAGMNRLRHAYQEMVPGLETYFITSAHDDMAGVVGLYGAPGAPRSRAGVLHALTTAVGMFTVIVAAVAAALAGDTLLLLGAGAVPALVGGVVTLIAVEALALAYMTRSIGALIGSLEPRFPTPPRSDPGAPR